MKKAGIILSATGFVTIILVSFLFYFKIIAAFPFYMVMIWAVVLFPLGLSFLFFNKTVAQRKKIAKIGFISSFVLIGCGYLSAIYHLPGARIEDMIGIIFLSFFYGPLKFKDKYETWKVYARSKRNAFVLSLLDFVGMGAMMLGALFQFQHWPWGRELLLIGATVLFFGVILWKRILKREVFYRKEAEDKVKESLIKIEESHKEIRDSINYAKRLQDAILPSDENFQKTLSDSFILYKPKDIVAGDFYWMETIGNLTFVAVADCTGHGVPGAMVSVVCNNALNRTINEFGLKDPNKILDKVNELVQGTFNKNNENVKDGMDISLISVELEALSSEKKIMKWAGANNPLWIVRKNELIEIKADKQPIGYYEKRKPFTIHEIKIEKGDVLYLFTDGYADQFGGPKGKKFKYKQISEKLLAISGEKMSDQKNVLEETLSHWKGNLEQVDDICMIGIRF
jgi:serine phosphatase RsbU (regulator of sigma subunit)